MLLTYLLNSLAGIRDSFYLEPVARVRETISILVCEKIRDVVRVRCRSCSGEHALTVE
jgi:hypothetical protein